MGGHQTRCTPILPHLPTQGGREGEREDGRRPKERKSQWMIKIAWLLEAEGSSLLLKAGHAHTSTSTLSSHRIRLRPLSKGPGPGLDPEWESTVSVQRTIRQRLLSRNYREREPSLTQRKFLGKLGSCSSQPHFPGAHSHGPGSIAGWVIWGDFSSSGTLVYWAWMMQI